MSKTDIPYLDEVLNVTSGCTKINEGCANCYAERINLRFGHTPAYDVNCPIKTHPERLKQALCWQTPRRAGLCFTSDLFHEGVLDEFSDQVFAVMALTPQHTYMLLTKRPERMRAYLNGSPYYPACAVARIHGEILRRTGQPTLVPWPLPNVWLGVSCENQARADERIPLLLDTPAAHRWVSLEPLLSAIDLRGHFCCDPHNLGGHLHLPSIEWVVCGGESGPKARPCDLGWIRDINQQCKAAGVKRYVKQVGAKPVLNYYDDDMRNLYDERGLLWPDPMGWNSYRDGQPPLKSLVNLCGVVRDRKGEDPSEWPADLQVREMPEGSE